MTNAELIKALQTDIREVEDDPVKTLSLMWRAADALEAQMPKEGEWIEQDDGDSIFFKCSVCGKIQYNVLLEMMQGEYHYCPNCGARMQTVTDCHALEEGKR